MERDEEIKGLLTGHIEELAAIMGRLIKKAEGEQWRCPQCGSFGPKRSKVGLRDAAAVVQVLMMAVKDPGETATVIPIQVNVVAGGPVVPYTPDDG